MNALAFVRVPSKGSGGFTLGPRMKACLLHSSEAPGEGAQNCRGGSAGMDSIGGAGGNAYVTFPAPSSSSGMIEWAELTAGAATVRGGCTVVDWCAFLSP